jgi:NADPH-dependent 2,4-dienoyl-CoA reductase/sulfur reductase-like enzyme
MCPRSERLVARTLRRRGDRVGAIGNKRQEARVLVVGGGIGGLVFALAARRKGCEFERVSWTSA